VTAGDRRSLVETRFCGMRRSPFLRHPTTLSRPIRARAAGRLDPGSAAMRCRHGGCRPAGYARQTASRPSAKRRGACSGRRTGAAGTP